MVVGIIMGRKGSRGFPGKNVYDICGKPMCQWVMEEAVKGCDIVYVTTDDERIMAIADQTGVNVIKRDKDLCGSSALGEDVYLDAYKKTGVDADAIALLCCNAPTFLAKNIKNGATVLRNFREVDSACTVSKHNYHHPIRAKFVDEYGKLASYYTQDGGTCDRDSAGDAWFYDCSVAVIRPSCLENIEAGMPPQKWLGKNVWPIFNEAGVDVDYEYQLGQVEWWLKKNHGL